MIRPLYGRGIDYPLLLTFGLSYLLVEGVRVIAGPQDLPFDIPDELIAPPTLASATSPPTVCSSFGVTAVVLVLLWLFWSGRITA